MSPKRWILLLIFYISYLMFGASIYYHIEHGEEKIKRANELKERIEINAYLVEQLANKSESTQNEILNRISAYCGKSVTDYTLDLADIPYTWTFYHAFFFAFTVCSTVGYGNISPTTTLGRMIMIVYSVIGIPVNGILFAGLGEYFSKTFEAIYRRYKKYKMTLDSHYVAPRLGLITTVIIALVPGIAIFLLLPAWVFSYFEHWPYSIAFYYSYVTTTTIGFGDYVPTFGANQPTEFGSWFVVYQIFVIIWFIFSLGYLVMIMTFITRGLQSKKLAYLEQQLSSNLKATQNRIWTGVTKDVGYLRRLLNELYILKVKPVYTEPDFSYMLHRSNSCPELSMYRVEPAPLPSRKRAFSVCYDVHALEAEAAAILPHASSDTEISKYDREKTFETAEAYRQTTDLLAKVVTALATVKPPLPEEEDPNAYAGGYHGLSDSQILASEWSFSTMNELSVPRPMQPRGRACSDFNIEPHWQAHRPMMPHNEWTWSGDNNQIQEAINNRYKGRRSSEANGLERQPYVVNLDDEDQPAKKPTTRAKKFSMPDGLLRLFPFKKRPSQEVGGGSADARKFSIASVPEAAAQRPGMGATSVPPLDYYSTVTASASSSFFQNGKSTAATAAAAISSSRSIFPSNTSLASRQSLGNGALGFTNLGFSDESTEPGASNANLGTGAGSGGGAYQRKSAASARKRRESLFTPNPAISSRRGSMFPPSSAAQMSRRGSLAPTGSAAMAAAAARRGSLFPATATAAAAAAAGGAAGRRSSLFSVTSDRNMDVLEQTTLADLIRALEVVHTHAVLGEQQQQQQQQQQGASGAAGGAKTKADKKQRKMGNAGLDPPLLPPLLSLFAGDQTRTLQAAAANRLYARRSTIVGTMSAAPSALTQRRRPSGVQLVEPPPSYSEKPLPSLPSTSAAGTAASGTQSKFRRRFSVRPTALQIPPGQAPAPGTAGAMGSSTSPPSTTSTSTASLASSPVPPPPPPSMTSTFIAQIALQRRLSLRPSPLARELNLPTSAAAAATSDASAALTIAAAAHTQSLPTNDPLTSRLLPPPGGGIGASASGSRPSTSSTHSPLSRIAQISQAQRKSSMPDESVRKGSSSGTNTSDNNNK